MSELMSDDDDITVISASATISFIICALLRNNGLKKKGVILCALSCHQQICPRHVCVRLSVKWSSTLTSQR